MSIVSFLPSRSSEPPSVRGALARLWAWTDRPDSAALHGLVSGAIWFLVGTLLGLVMSNELTMPDLFEGIAPMTWSRLRPAHVSAVLYGFLSVTYYGAWYFIVPRLCKTPLRSNRLANAVVLLWNVFVTIGILAILGGDSQGREYTEFPWYVDWPVEILLLLNIYIVFGTIAARREPKLYVSLWYIGGTVLWIFFLYAIGSVIWHHRLGPVLWSQQSAAGGRYQ
jgi:cbb3-type cytochrome oxidase subunit 1